MAADPAARTPPAAPAPLARRPDRPLSANTASGEIRNLPGPGPVLISVPEAASLLRVGVRTVWRLMADPKAGFPKPRRLRGRTLLVRDELLAFLEVEATR